MEDTPRWIPILFGSVALLMGALILGALFGIVPTDGGRFMAPPIVILALGLGMLLGGLMLWIPQKWPASIKTLLLTGVLVSMSVVCNWTAFAPGVVYQSSTSFGPVTIEGESSIGGRIAFGVAAAIVDLVVLSILIGWVRALWRRT